MRIAGRLSSDVATNCMDSVRSTGGVVGESAGLLASRFRQGIRSSRMRPARFSEIKSESAIEFREMTLGDHIAG